MSAAKRVGIIAALPGELKPLVRGWASTKVDGTVLYRWQSGQMELIALSCGIGREPAARACTLALQGGALAAIVSIGWAGALSCGMKAGEAYSVHEVVDAATGERYRTSAAAAESSEIRLVTTRRIAGKAEKRKLAESYSAVLVDMEAATVGRLARVHDIPFYCLKAVSDGSNESLPDMNPFLTRAGQIKMASLVGSVVVRPQYWPALMRMGKNSSRGAIALGAAVNRLADELSEGEFTDADHH